MQESNDESRVRESFPKMEGSGVTNRAKANRKQIALYSATLIAQKIKLKN